MRRFLKASTPYLIFLISILFWPNEIFFSITGRNSGTRDGEALYDIRPHTNDNCGIILGSSTAQRGINPNKISVGSTTFYNLASSAQTVEGSLQILLNLMKIKPLEFIILDIYSNFYCLSSREFAYDYLGRNPLHNGIQDASFFFAQKDNYLSLLFLRSLIHGNNNNLPDRENIRGHKANITNELEEMPDCKTFFTEPTSPNTQSLITIYNICRKTKTKLFITIPPDLCDSLHVDLHNHIKSIAPSISILDGNLWEKRSPSYFFDDHHLNRDGALAYSSWLNSQLNNALQQP